MSDNLRVLETLFATADSINSGTLSAVCSVGTADNVAVLVQNASGAVVTIVIDVCAPTTLTPGRNALPASNSPLWTRLFKRDGSAAYSLTVADGASAAIDLSPFGPNYLRLNATRTGGAGTGLTAQCIANG